ncbi:hypothetical protein CLPU_24c00010 [Gottschalkia purinilytica]|uniref:Uncharacterized protein n=1 Tax=Gottschalkia purinilytica TaxID=1503 RepID=A0A0L0W6J3_GOTPU|nr:hypothetical protein [Gottschalkia purinilytica]KNF07107.1 hypothetical protein CLPU_24c00010 [Gottschalkia purinilytica]
MKRKFGLTLTLAIMAINTVPVFAQDGYLGDKISLLDRNIINEEKDISAKEGVIKLVEKYGLEIISEEDINKIDINHSETNYSKAKTLEEFEQQILEYKSKPTIITRDFHNYETDTLITQSSTGSMTKNYESEVYNGLIIRYSATGRYGTRSNGKKYWTSATSSKVSEKSNQGYSRLNSVNSTSVSVGNNGDRLEQRYSYDVDNYTRVFGIWVKLGTVTSTGTIYHYI